MILLLLSDVCHVVFNRADGLDLEELLILVECRQRVSLVVARDPLLLLNVDPRGVVAHLLIEHLLLELLQLLLLLICEHVARLLVLLLLLVLLPIRLDGRLLEALSFV